MCIIIIIYTNISFFTQQVDPKKDVVLDVSSTSSEFSDDETPLTQLNAQELLAKVSPFV